MSAAERLSGAGVFGVEMFLTGDGDLLINEIAPRVHNSGHYTIEACHTSQFAQHLLANPWLLEGAEPRLAALWQWHSAEELEHRSTAFDLYRALGGNEPWRRRLFRIVSFNFVADAARQTVNNLWHDGTLFQPSTWASAWRTLFGRAGLVRRGFGPWRAYLRADFHPLQGDGSAGTRWLGENAALAPPVRG